MQRSLSIWPTLCLLLLVTGHAQGRAGSYIPPPRPAPGGFHGGGGPHGHHVPDVSGQLGAVALLVIGGIVVGVLCWQLGKFLGGRSQKRHGTFSPQKVALDQGSRRWAGPNTSTTGPMSVSQRAVEIESDPILDPVVVAVKASTTRDLLDSLAKRDPDLNADFLNEWITATFYRIQECWQNRDYGPVRERLMPPILAKHEDFFREMRANHEVNRMEELEIQELQFVHIHCPAPDEQELAALITFQAASYYVDDRTRAYRRGPRRARTFQEFWIFHRQGETWRLQSIERSNLSARLHAPNYVDEKLRDDPPTAADDKGNQAVTPVTKGKRDKGQKGHSRNLGGK